jgi:glutamate synthase domain-containing protein 2/glutamate synthase domain-containing protein 1/glutamate synthase domain-containing protein 3
LPLPQRELDACGIGFTADSQGRPSREIVAAALQGLAGVRHRGAVAADARTSDGIGLLTPLPPGVYGEGNGVAMLFVRDPDPASIRPAIEALAGQEDLRVVDWRIPPTDEQILGDDARASRPHLVQAIFTIADERLSDREARERAAFRLRRRIGGELPRVYAASCSFRTIVHKGLVAADALSDYYLDLARSDFEASFAVFHQRFSTNTLPSWERSQPFRVLCQNGEINTIEGNENRMRGRGRFGTEEVGLGPEDLFHPLLDPDSSDSGRIDEAVELLVRGGRRIEHAMAMVVPEAWELVRDLEPEVRGFYQYHSALMEPWDGPAGLIFTDGFTVGACLDRNGLRPLRYAVCQDGFVVCCSEMGAVDLTGHGTVERGRLGPGHMICVDPELGFVCDLDVKASLGEQAPYAQWATDGFSVLSPGEPLDGTPDELVRLQATHGYTKEELAMVLKPMVDEAHEPTFAMGDDSPLPNLAGRARPVAHYLRQRFAQVTNPPIDPLRERLVMSTRVLLGPRLPLLAEHADAAQLLELPSFLMYPSGVDALQSTAANPFVTVRLDATFAVADGPGALEAAVRELAERAAVEVGGGAGVLVIDHGSVSATRAPIPSLLVTGAVHQRLTATGRRTDTSLVVVADDARDVHAVSALVGFGADAVCPRLALETVAAEADRSESAEVISPEAQARFLAAIEAGVLKVLSKMGIATVDSYRGAQIFESIGLAPEIVDPCFSGTPAPVGGVGWDVLGADVLGWHRAAGWDADAAAEVAVDLESPGFFRVRKGGEPHGHSKEMVDALTQLTLSAEPPRATARGGGRAVAADGNGARNGARNGRVARAVGVSDDASTDPAVTAMAAAHLLQRAIAGESYDQYEGFARLVNERSPMELHDLLELRPPAGAAVPLDEVEPASAIVARFSTGAMSHGSLSKEAHENLARAMNLIGARSNCGEGGEDPARFATRGQGRDDRNSKIKQVASGRFGVTPEYLAYADEIQIKIAQGSKPGEGGQLPGHKVSKEIARLRHTQPGVGLISPPPHHDIYSIEDLAQLVYDLKQINAAQVSVKLVSAFNVGTIAAGVVKALADVIHLSGANGGTGASPLSSIKHAGMPWEIGLADVQQALMANGLRDRVRVRADGGFKTGRQVITAALLGADEFSFGTAAMIAEGCIMLRACHRDTCKPGVATQREHLRANFRGTPEGVAAYFMFVAEEVRRYLAQLGARTVDEVIGRVDLLGQKVTGDPRADAVDLTALLAAPAEGAPRHFAHRVEAQDPRADLGDQLLVDAYRAIWDGDRVELAYDIANTDRSFGAALSGALALEYGQAIPRGHALVRVRGSAGQSFGAFLGPGVEVHLTGEANDYVGKGMAGGRIVIRPPANDATVGPGATRTAKSPVLGGNTCLYGATGGELFVAGAVGERFAVRNSGAVAVVESVGDHCGEYMTGGTLVVLGRVGYNVGAGMTGGELFVWDPEIERLMTRVNMDLVEVARPDHEAFETLRWLVERHVELTGSARGRLLMAEWPERLDQLWHIVPRDRQRLITQETAQRVATA